MILRKTWNHKNYTLEDNWEQQKTLGKKYNHLKYKLILPAASTWMAGRACGSSIADAIIKASKAAESIRDETFSAV